MLARADRRDYGHLDHDGGGGGDSPIFGRRDMAGERIRDTCAELRQLAEALTQQISACDRETLAPIAAAVAEDLRVAQAQEATVKRRLALLGDEIRVLSESCEQLTSSIREVEAE